MPGSVADTASSISYDRRVAEDPDLTGSIPPDEQTGELEPVTDSSAEAPVDGEDLVDLPGFVRDERTPGGTQLVIVMGFLGVVVLVLLSLSSSAFSAFEELLGFGLVVFGILEATSFIRSKARRATYIQPVIALVAGVTLIVWPEQTIVVSGYVLAGAIGARGLFDVWSGLRARNVRGSNTWIFIRGLLGIAIAAVVFLFPSESIAIVVVGGAAIAIVRAVIAVWFLAVSRGADDTVEPSDTYGILAYWLSRREMDAIEADDVEERVFLHRGARRARLWRFGVLMGLATAIATFGIATGSTAVVIGAMLVAPLMTPILGVAAGLINGRTASTAASALIVAMGSIGAIALAWLLGALIPDLDAVVQNAQVTSRTAPSLLDLAIALAAGAAGAYGVSRAESTDALPGVAVAIALVPPLAVVGITLRAGDLGQASGAILLFLTNLFSIVLIAGIVFVLVGYGSWGRLYLRRNRIRVSFAAVILAVILITIPLALTAKAVLQESSDLRNATSAVTTWLGEDTTLRIESIDVDHDDIVVQLVGPDLPPAADSLADGLEDRIGRPVVAVVRWIEESESRSDPLVGN